MKREARILKIEQGFEIIGIFENGVQIGTMKKQIINF